MPNALLLVGQSQEDHVICHGHIQDMKKVFSMVVILIQIQKAHGVLWNQILQFTSVEIGAFVITIVQETVKKNEVGYLNNPQIHIIVVDTNVLMNFINLLSGAFCMK